MLIPLSTLIITNFMIPINSGKQQPLQQEQFLSLNYREIKFDINSNFVAKNFFNEKEQIRDAATTAIL